MLNDQKKREELDKILNSQEFKDSKSYKNLLSYLVESSIKNETPTEASIAIEGLGKKESFDQSTDASVRVYIHNLRKKLASYYVNEGKLDTYKIAIPKGQHYQVIFSPIKGKSKKNYIIATNVIVVAILIIFNIYYLSDNSNPIITDDSLHNESLVWNDFANSKLPNLIVFGDFFIFKDISDELPKYIRDFRINSSLDLDTLNETNTRSNYVDTELTFLGKSSIDCFPAIYETVKSWGRTQNVILSSQLTWDDITSNNIVFIGNFKTLRVLNDLIKNLNSSYRIHPNTIFFYDELADTSFEYHAPKDTKTGYLKDYALVAKIPGPNNNSIIIFTGTHDIGQSATVNSFTSPEFLKEFDKNIADYETNEIYFEGIFEVQGFERTGFHPNLIHFHKLPADFQIQNIE